jgi:amidohydrolase
MDTAFLATIGQGRPRIALFAEYDALPNGQACGHNVVSAFAYGLSLALAKSADFAGAVYLFGTPAEEGIGPFASSKALMVPEVVKLGIDAAFFAHPKGRWDVGAHTLSKSRKAFTFLGTDGSSSEPEDTINALDAAVQFYIGFKLMRSSIALRKYVTLNAVFSDGGVTPKWRIPGRAEVRVEIKTDDEEYAQELFAGVRQIAKSAAQSIGATVEESDVGPYVAPLKRHSLENTYYNAARRFLSSVNNPDVVWARPVGGASADIGNISQVVPTAYLGIKIGHEGLDVHTDEYRDAAGSKAAEEAIVTAVAIGYEAVLEYASLTSWPT